jgi:phosphoadenosine phosphosulfate reductase
MGVDRVSDLRRIVRRAENELVGATATDVLSWTDQVLEGRWVVASSMQDALVVDLAARARPDLDVVFLDTGYHFPETLLMRDAVAASYPIRLLNVQPGQDVPRQGEGTGAHLFERDPDLCCHLRKTLPLNAVLGLYDGWVTGLRRGETENRATAAPVERDEPRQMVKINPIVDWSDDDIESHLREHQVLVNVLREQGYPSIGCAPCTMRPVEGQGARSGRWRGSGKSECGIHLQ